MAAAVAAASLHPDQDTDPRELEAFAERFKQRRIKLGKYFKEEYFHFLKTFLLLTKLSRLRPKTYIRFDIRNKFYSPKH